jgi:cell division protein ZapE
MPSALQATYDERLAAGDIRPDPAQAAGLKALARLQTELAQQAPANGLKRLFRKKTEEGPRGVYLYGPVGRGKSMLMDLFFETAPSTSKRRTHFHVFMGEIHRLIDAWRRGDPAARRARFGQHKGDDPIPPVADVVAAQARLLCFDEFQVTDIADAMILGRLFEALFARGVTLVATSNRHPDELYKNGLNRQLFLPFIDLLKGRVDVVEVAGGHD